MFKYLTCTKHTAHVNVSALLWDSTLIKIRIIIKRLREDGFIALALPTRTIPAVDKIRNVDYLRHVIFDLECDILLRAGTGAPLI